MKNINWYLVLLFTLSVTGCVTAHHYQEPPQHWQGKNLQNLQTAWGKPNSISRLSNGNMLYIYKQEQLYTTPPRYPANSTNFVQIDGKNRYIASYEEAVQGQTVTRYCRTEFEITTQGVVVKATAYGNSCANNSLISATS